MTEAQLTHCTTLLTDERIAKLGEEYGIDIGAHTKALLYAVITEAAVNAVQAIAPAIRKAALRDAVAVADASSCLCADQLRELLEEETNV